MIFVSVGTNEARFARLLHAVAELDLDEELVVQHGHSVPVDRPGLRNIDFLPFEEMVATIRRARVVVTHAGVGSVMVSLGNGKRPIVVPRLKTFGEAVDDHQLQLGRRFAAAGLVRLVESPEGLAAALDEPQEPVAIRHTSGSLSAELTRFIAETIEPGLTSASASA